MTTPAERTRRIVKADRRVIRLGAVGFLLVYFVMGIAFYTRTVQLRDSQVAACHRGQARSVRDAQSWYAGYQAWTAEARSPSSTPEDRQIKLNTAGTYYESAAADIRNTSPRDVVGPFRGEIVCEKVYPPPPFPASLLD